MLGARSLYVMTWLVFQVYNKNEDFYAAVEVLPAPIRAFFGCEIQLQCPPGRTDGLWSACLPDDTLACNVNGQERSTPEYDVLLTNPPYSGDHWDRLLDFGCYSSSGGGAAEGGGAGGSNSSSKPLLALMPDFIAERSGFKQRAAECGKRWVFLGPKEKAYRFAAPTLSAVPTPQQSRPVSIPPAKSSEVKCCTNSLADSRPTLAAHTPGGSLTVLFLVAKCVGAAGRRVCTAFDQEGRLSVCAVTKRISDLHVQQLPVRLVHAAGDRRGDGFGCVLVAEEVRQAGNLRGGRQRRGAAAAD